MSNSPWRHLAKTIRPVATTARHRGSTLRRTARALRPHVPVLGVLAAVCALGVWAVDDYGLATDQELQYDVGRATVDWVLGENDDLLRRNMRYYGAVFEVALLAVERVLGLTDKRHIYLGRYIASHCFFLVGALACYLLARRVFDSRVLAFYAMLFFLCHPRIHGTSFFNSKDIPFLSMFMIALLLVHWALRRRAGAGGFALLGVWLGLAGTIRPMAFLLVALVAAARCVDLFGACRRERIRILAGGGALVSSSCAAFVAGMPYLWGDPAARLVEWLALMWDHTSVTDSLFLGEMISTDERPFSYVPVWMAATTPPLVLVLALLGGGAFLAKLAARPRRGLADDRLRFQVLLAACVLATVVVVTLWVGNIYNGWRHLHFLYGPMCLAAAGGLAWLGRRAGPRLAALGRGLAALGVGPAFAWMVILHPHGHVYFNFLVDRKTPERLRTQFDMDFWYVGYMGALEFLLDAHPGRFPVTGRLADSIVMLPAAERRRIADTIGFSAWFDTLYSPYWRGQQPYIRPVYTRRVFASTLYAITRLEVDVGANRQYHGDYLRALSSPPVAIAPFNVHWHDNVLTYLREDCEPADAEPFVANGGVRDLHGRFFLHVIGDDKRAPRSGDRDFHSYHSYHNLDFQFRHRGVVFTNDGRRVCMARVSLRGFEVDVIRTGQLDGKGEPLWSHEIRGTDPSALRDALARVRTATPVASGGFDVHWDAGAIVFVREDCTAEERGWPFFLHAVPFDLGAVPRSVARQGFVNRDFLFATHGAVQGGVCVARARLPRLGVRAVKTGQYKPGGGELWRVEFLVPDTGVGEVAREPDRRRRR